MGVLRRSEVDVPRPARLRIGLVRLVLAVLLALRVVCDEAQRLAQAQLPRYTDSIGRTHAGGGSKKLEGGVSKNILA